MRRAAAYQRAFLATIVACLIWRAEAAHVKITHDGPAVLGADITFRADLLNNGKPPSGTFIYKWKDNAIPAHYHETETTGNTTTFFTVSYPAPNYHVGEYNMEVSICKWTFLNLNCGEYTSSRIPFYITPLLNGKIIIEQSNKTVSNKYVSSAEVAKLSVDIRKKDFEFINKTATSINTSWYIGCNLVNNSNSLKLDYNFTKPLTTQNIQAVVVANFDPPITTTAAPPTTTTLPTPVPANRTTVAPTTPTSITTTAFSTSTSKIPTNTLKSDKSNATVPQIKDLKMPFICNSTLEPVPNDTYGFFERTINIRAPINNLNVDGSTWIQAWTGLYLTVTCNGTGPFNKCIEIHAGKYNITGNETCNQDYEKLDACKFTVEHYFLEALEWTVVVILSNDVSTEIHPLAINIYKFTPKPQLSVIIVPVSCSLVAVVIIVFGIAYYIQNRSRFTIEVADFDFGQRSAEMEYKTFTERLRDSFNNAGYKRMNNTPNTSEQAAE